MTNGSRQPNDNANGNPDSTPVGCWFVPVLFLLLVAVDWGGWHAAPPVVQSDWNDVELAIQDNLAAHAKKGLYLDFNDDSWVGHYLQVHHEKNHDWIFNYSASGETAAHSPASAYLIAASRFVAADWDFFIVTIARLGLALALALLINSVRRQLGWAACFVGILAIILDATVYQAPLYRSGDTWVTTLVVLSFLCFISGIDATANSDRSVWSWPAAGILFGLTTLFQPMTAYWLIIMMAVWLGVLARQYFNRRHWQRSFESFALFWIGIVVVAAPWWVRNCRVTGEFRPLGYAVGINLVGAYGSGAIAPDGNLNVAEILNAREDELDSPDLNGAELIKQEAHLCGYGEASAWQWIGEHSAELPLLLFRRIANHFSLSASQPPVRILVNAVIFLGGLFGCIMTWRTWGAWIVILVAASTLVTALTWSEFGRLLIPLRPLIDVAFGIGVACLFGFFSGQRGKLPYVIDSEKPSRS